MSFHYNKAEELARKADELLSTMEGVSGYGQKDRDLANVYAVLSQTHALLATLEPEIAEAGDLSTEHVPGGVLLTSTGPALNFSFGVVSCSDTCVEKHPHYHTYSSDGIYHTHPEEGYTP